MGSLPHVARAEY